MGINAIGTTGYPLRRYQIGKAERSIESGAVESIKTTAEQVVQENIIDYDEKAFAMVGPNAPQNVKDVWMEAAKEVHANGLGIRENGMMTHISQMMVQRLDKIFRGECGSPDILGNSVKSAIRATKQALYDLEHPIAYTPKSIEVQQAQIKERQFYHAFLEKLEQLDKSMIGIMRKQ